MNRAVLRRRLWHQLLGLVFLVVCALFFVTTVAIYKKAFTPVDMVRLETDHVGNQLVAGSDVKVRGVVVGEVRVVNALGDHAAIDLALDPGKIGQIPENVSARLLPKTLFGERYVALQLPDRPSSRSLAAGDVIPQDRSSSAVELEKVLDDVMPLLQSVQPQKLSATLSAVSTALQGRGEQLGQTLGKLSDYLGGLNPSLPDIKADITSFANVTDVYDKAAPDFLQALSDLTTTSKTVVEKQQQLTQVYESVTNVSNDLTSFLRVNENNIIRLTATSQSTLDVLAKYAPEYPCLLQQFAESVPRAYEAFGYGTDQMNHVTIRFVADRTKYVPGQDEPKYTDKRGPRCYPQVLPPGRWPQYPPGGPVQDGSTHPPVPPGENTPLPSNGIITGGSGTTGSVANSPAEQDLIGVLTAPALDTTPDQVPGWTSLLVGPLYRGTEVDVQ
ncbi:virulence factor Mce-like protein [Amycolatopsis bartoniae]|uniref:ABC transporter substrate-binding protein n=1 Tax=Amycolatopsis bartoniae TaxID=941986 RepID=A0A8H9MF03_9PSEU|nr:MCE family protein [Amycolatopsis bartoniae]MBB2937538.1 virulence factor Mce-like protein [Amycolatopsis bartoniae]TVT05945.1 MCE family protein [Amycolatopsis bartoniae]GHF82034.1 ABC transporter substrate-binding protein [Amycolatopsis bartoniae]